MVGNRSARLGLFFVSCIFGASVFNYRALAQGSQVPSSDACSSTPAPAYDGIPIETSDRTELVARGLEAAETAKALLIGSDALRSARWCPVEDAAAKAKSMNHWRNVVAADGGALADRLANSKADTTIYLIRVAKGQAMVSAEANSRVTPNYAVIIDQPTILIIAGYFAGRPNTENILGHLVLRGRINKADGKTALSVPN
jgi:hypothetical protein